MNFTDVDKLLGMSDESNPLMMLVWILPIILFVFYGQRIQLYVTSGEIKKAIKKLDAYSTESKKELLGHVEEITGVGADYKNKISRMVDYFTIMPVDMDPAGIIPKIRHVMRTREDVTRQQVRTLAANMDELQEAKVQTLLEIASSLQMIHKTVNHMFLTAKKQNNYPLILPLQMILPFVMEQAEAMRDSIPAFKRGVPIGDGIGPMVVGKMMHHIQEKKTVALHTIVAKDTFEGRSLIMIKAQGPAPVVGRPADAVQYIISELENGEKKECKKIDIIIMIDAALKMEGEESASISQGFGAAIGGIGTERYDIEKHASDAGIPIFSIVVKESVREAITYMTREIAQRADEVTSQMYDTIRENTSEGQTILIIGVGNTAGVAQ